MRDGNDTFPFPLYLVLSEVDCAHHPYLEVAKRAIRGGVDIIQLREKQLDPIRFLERALRLKEITERYSIPLIINDNLSVSKQVGAYGIHVGVSDVSPVKIRKTWPECKSIGYSLEDLAQLSFPEAKEADWFGVSPIYSTRTKTDTVTEWGMEGVARIRALTEKPLIAIGRINKSNAGEAIRSGADSVAVVSAICGAIDPDKAAYELKNELIKA